MKERKQKYKPYREWYFVGYVRQETTDPVTGKRRSELVYRGEYYEYNTDSLTGYKLIIAGLLILSIGCICGIWTIPGLVSSGWAGILNLILAVPILFLLFCTGHFVLQKIPLTSRQIHAGYYEMSKWVTWNFMLSGAILLGNIIFLILNRKDMEPGRDIWTFVFFVIYIAANRVWYVLLKKNYPVQVSGQ